MVNSNTELPTKSMANLQMTLLLSALTFMLTPGVTFAGGYYCCDNNDGRPVCGDMLPRACYGKAYREMKENGTVKRFISAPLTKEQLAEKRRKERLQQERELKELAQFRKDKALFESYISLDDLNAREQKDLDELDRSMRDAQEKKAKLLVEQKSVEQQAGTYSDEDLPREIRVNLRGIDSELDSYDAVIKAKTEEKEKVRRRYLEDRQRYKKLLKSNFLGRKL